MKSSKEQRLDELAVLQYMCRADLLFFTRYFYKKRYGRRFIVNPHHRIVCDALNKLMSGQCRKLILNISPRYSKTELAVINHIANGLGRNPEAKFIHLSYSDDLVQTNSESVRDIINMEEFKALFGDLDIKKDSRAKKNWKTTKNGGMYSVATGGQVTGFGAGIVDNKDIWGTFWEEFSDVFADDLLGVIDEQQGLYGGSLVIDDPIKPEDAESDLVRDTINRRFDTTLKNRVNSRNTPICLMMQRVHPFDMSGHLLDSDTDWKVVKLPAILTPEDLDRHFDYVNDDQESCNATLRDIYKEEYDVKINEVNRAVKDVDKHSKERDKAKRIIEAINLKKENLDLRDREFALWDFKHKIDELNKLREDDITTFDRQYMQNPKPAYGLMYPREWKTYDQINFKFETIRNYTDVADEGNDYLCSIDYGVYQNLKYVIDIVYTQAPTEVTVHDVAQMLTRDEVDDAMIESNNGGRAYSSNVEKKCRELSNFNTYFNPFFQRGNKDARIKSNSATVQNTIVFPADWAIRWKKFHEHISNYMLIGKNKFDDAPDTLTGMVEKEPYGDQWASVT